MRFNILCDASWEADIDLVLHALDVVRYWDHFEQKSYGTSLLGVTIVLNCHDPSREFKQRIRFSKKEKKIYLDIMLDFDLFLTLSNDEKVKIVANKILTEVPKIVSKYKLDDFNLPKFELDLKKLFGKFI